MKENFTEMLFAFDCGSDASSQPEKAQKAFLSFMNAQKKLDGEASITAVAFNKEIIPYWDNKPIQKWTKKDQRFSLADGQGECRMLDAVMQLIDAAGVRLSNTPEEQRPDKVICVICVFGADNASKKCTYDHLAEMIALQRDVYKWKFFLLTDFTRNMEKLGISPDDTIVIHKDLPDMFAPIYRELSERVASIRNEGRE